MKAKAFSFVEVLTVVIIVALLAALALPALVKSKAKAKETPCVSNLHQLGIAWQLYLGDHDEKWPATIGDFVSSSQHSVLICPSDKFSGANKTATTELASEVSYFYIPNIPPMRSDLAAADPNSGVLFCVLHGEFRKTLEITDVRNDTNGEVLRVIRDGSVQHATVDHVCSQPSGNGFISGRPDWTLLTDAPCPKRWCGDATIHCR